MSGYVVLIGLLLISNVYGFSHRGIRPLSNKFQKMKTNFNVKSDSGADEEFTIKPVEGGDLSGIPQGYMPSDLSTLDDGKQFRVLAYIALSLIPCLLLIPFFLSRDFVPPIDDLDSLRR